MRGKERPGTVYWIDHFVVCTSDAMRWEAFHTELLGGHPSPEPEEVRRRRGVFVDVTRGRHGGFLSMGRPVPPSRGLGKGHPRYGFYIRAADIDMHRRRLDKVGARHSDPVRTSADGEAGTAIYWQDPDDNQFEFWAPDNPPEGAMIECSPAGVGHISHAVLDSRDLDRTADFFDRYCALDPARSADIETGTLVLPLAAGGRLVYKKVDQLEGRTTGCGLPDPHTALTVRDEDFLPNYRRLWANLPEWDYNVRTDPVLKDPGLLPACTVMHINPAGQRFKKMTGRGDDFFDCDTNMFHFQGGTPVNNSMSVYTNHPLEDFFVEWEKSGGRPQPPHATVQVAAR